MTSRSPSGLSSLANLDSKRVLRLVSAATAGDAGQVNHPSGPDPLVIGKCIRHRRKRCGLTLGDLGERVGISASAVSLIETGKREAKVSTLAAMAEALDCQLADLLTDAAPSRRATLELELERAQRSRSFAELGIPAVKAGPRLPLDALESLVALHDRLAAYSAERDGTPEYARRANADLRARMRASDNYFPAIEDLADELVLGVDHDGGPLTRHRVNAIADRLGFSLHSVPNLPQSTRSVTDLAARRIFLPTSDSAAQRTLALAALGHVVLQHRPPADYAEFLAQRVEVNYFAAAVLIPQRWAVAYLREARDNKGSGDRGPARSLSDVVRDGGASIHQSGHHPPRHPGALHEDQQGGHHLQGLCQRRSHVPGGRHRGRRGPAGLPVLDGAPGLRAA